MGGGAWGTMLHNNVLWTSLGEGSLILVEFRTWRGFSQVKIAM